MPTCLNLRQLFADRFRITRDEARKAEYGPNGCADDPWLPIIPCQHGHIYPYGGTLLGVSTNKRGSVATRLIELDCTTIDQVGDDGVNATFDVADFERVASLMKPRRRRSLSPESRQANAERYINMAGQLNAAVENLHVTEVLRGAVS